MAASGRAIVLGALLAGFSVGFRSQTLWITAPLLLLVLADRVGRGVAGAMLGSSVAFAAGALTWGVPLLVASGGLQAYLAALGSQAGEDFAGVEMLYLNPTPRLAAFALLRTFVWPWDSVPLASVVLMLAAVGGVLLLVRERRTLAAVTAISAPVSGLPSCVPGHDLRALRPARGVARRLPCCGRARRRRTGRCGGRPRPSPCGA